MWTFTTDVQEFARAAEAFLLTDPVSNTVPLTVLTNLRSGRPAPDAYFGWWTDGGQVRGAAFRTPPRPIGLARMPVEAAAGLVEALKGDIPEVVGPRDLTEVVAGVLGQPGEVIAERLYRLGSLNVPDVPGHGRPAVEGDLPVLVSWMYAFFDEVKLGAGEDAAQRTAQRLAHGELFVWESGGAPVSFAALSPAAGGVCRIGPVYTPHSQRRRGYGAAVTAFASRVGLDERCDQVVLFTDLANPTSNAIYQSIGYEPVSDYAQVTFRR
ncbi:GNAT family N-acetyltransferase [Nonomuraea sp. LPB2021202275-12-8]|uniref:GNAT family N-acetyltransferase n=1 Tax=Nonomuraea sp. LPB2021202275-12-8 TaxID=3120159 RepID=UPI00300D6D76